MNELTPEERQKIYAEEKARLEIRQEIQGKKRGIGSVLGFVALAILALLVLLFVAGSTLEDTRTRHIDDRDVATEIRAYSAAASDFIRKNATLRSANVASYRPSSVTGPVDGRYMVTLTYEGYDIHGVPAPKVALYSIKCTAGICMVMGGPK